MVCVALGDVARRARRKVEMWIGKGRRRSKDQRVMFEELEIMSPREVRERLGMKASRSWKKREYRLYNLEDVKRFLTAEKRSPKIVVKGKKLIHSSELECKECPLFRGEDKIVKTWGDLEKAKVMFIGEAPGRVEEEKGIPFVGESGQILRQALREAGFEEWEYALANACRCRPPQNKIPLRKERRCCFRFLAEDLERFKGRLVVLLGNTAISTFLSGYSVSEADGYGFFKDGRHWFVMVHPAYVLRNTKELDSFRENIKRIKKYVESNARVCYNMVKQESDLEGIFKMIDKSRRELIIAFDLETNHLPVYSKNSKILSLAFSFDGSSVWFVPLEHKESPFRDCSERILKKLQPIFNDENITLVAHNGIFDITFLMKVGIEVSNFKFDTKIAQYLVYGKRVPSGLKSMVWRWLPEYAGYDVDVSQLSDFPLERVAEYNSTDAFVTYHLYSVLKELLSDKQKRLMSEILCPAVLPLAKAQVEGVGLDSQKLMEYIEEYEKRAEEFRNKVCSYEEVKTWERDNGNSFNINSSSQLRQVLINAGIDTGKTTFTGQMAVDEDVLTEFSDNSSFIRDLLRYRKAYKILSTYLIPYSRVEGCVVNSEYFLTATDTGRLASRNPNFQNIPLEIRSVFRTKRDFLVEVDYEQLELRVLAMYCRDKNLIKAFVEGKDIHEETRRLIFGELPNSVLEQKRQRVKAKGVNFGIVYGISAEGLAKSVDCSVEEAKEMLRSFYRNYPGVLDYVKWVRRMVEENGYVETFLGRRRRFSLMQVPDIASFERILREAVNTPIQGTASDLVLDALARIWKEMKTHKLESAPVAEIHDSVLFDVKESELELLIELIYDVMQDFSHFPWVNVPVVVDVSIGKNWGEEMKSLKDILKRGGKVL